MRRLIPVMLWLALAILSCKKSDPYTDIPNVAVDVYIPLALPEYAPLNSVGNHVMVAGGYKGLIIFRKSIDEFAAYERACTFDPQASSSIIVADSSLVIGIDHTCGSRFNFFDGSVLNTPATRPMKQYACDYDPLTMSLRVHN